MKARQLPLRHQVGQLLIFGYDGVEPTPALDTMLRSIQPGGTILFARNIEGPRQTYALNARAHQALRISPFLCVDLEGGTVDRLRTIVAHTPDVASVAATEERGLAQRHGRLIGEEVRALGFNTDFAPVLDLDRESSRGVLTTRTASSEAKKVLAFAQAFLAGLTAVRVLGSGKHFPGLGEASLDSHKDMPIITKSMKRLWDEDLYPYRMLRHQLPFVMIAHAAYPEVTHDQVPASLSSKWMRGILRKKIGYDGIILSDDLEMGGALSAGAIEDISVATLRAGADMFLICHNQDFIWRSYEAVLRAAESDRRFAAHIETACDRVLRLKAKTKDFAMIAKSPTDAVIDKLRARIEAFKAQVTASLPL